jgi:IS605 OrfB family transposase
MGSAEEIKKTCAYSAVVRQRPGLDALFQQTNLLTQQATSLFAHLWMIFLGGHLASTEALSSAKTPKKPPRKKRAKKGKKADPVQVLAPVEEPPKPLSKHLLAYACWFMTADKPAKELLAAKAVPKADIISRFKKYWIEDGMEWNDEVSSDIAIIAAMPTHKEAVVIDNRQRFSAFCRKYEFSTEDWTAFTRMTGFPFYNLKDSDGSTSQFGRNWISQVFGEGKKVDLSQRMRFLEDLYANVESLGELDQPFGPHLDALMQRYGGASKFDALNAQVYGKGGRPVRFRDSLFSEATMKGVSRNGKAPKPWTKSKVLANIQSKLDPLFERTGRGEFSEKSWAQNIKKSLESLLGCSYTTAWSGFNLYALSRVRSCFNNRLRTYKEVLDLYKSATQAFSDPLVEECHKVFNKYIDMTVKMRVRTGNKDPDYTLGHTFLRGCEAGLGVMAESGDIEEAICAAVRDHKDADTQFLRYLYESLKKPAETLVANAVRRAMNAYCDVLKARGHNEHFVRHPSEPYPSWPTYDKNSLRAADLRYIRNGIYGITVVLFNGQEWVRIAIECQSPLIQKHLIPKDLSVTTSAPRSNTYHPDVKGLASQPFPEGNKLPSFKLMQKAEFQICDGKRSRAKINRWPDGSPKWYLQFSVSVSCPPQPPIPIPHGAKVVGVDLGCRKAAGCSLLTVGDNGIAVLDDKSNVVTHAKLLETCTTSHLSDPSKKQATDQLHDTGRQPLPVELEWQEKASAVLFKEAMDGTWCENMLTLSGNVLSALKWTPTDTRRRSPAKPDAVLRIANELLARCGFGLRQLKFVSEGGVLGPVENTGGLTMERLSLLSNLRSVAKSLSTDDESNRHAKEAYLQLENSLRKRQLDRCRKLACSIIKYTLSKGSVYLAVENLGIRPKRTERTTRFINRRISSTCFCRTIDLLQELCKEHGIRFMKLNPAYSSSVDLGRIGVGERRGFNFDASYNLNGAWTPRLDKATPEDIRQKRLTLLDAIQRPKGFHKTPQQIQRNKRSLELVEAYAPKGMTLVPLGRFVPRTVLEKGESKEILIDADYAAAEVLALRAIAKYASPVQEK